MIKEEFKFYKPCKLLPMVTFFKTLDVSNLVKISRNKRLEFNMLMCYYIGMAASKIKEFYMLPVSGKLMQFDTIAVKKDYIYKLLLTYISYSNENY